MTQKHILLTGGHTGIGLELTKMLLAENHKVGLVVRNAQRKQEALDQEEVLQKATFFFADMSKQKEVTELAESVSKEWTHLDVLFNNAGVLLDKVYTSEQGNEMHFEVNTLSAYLLTQKLLPLLKRSSEPKVINTATDMLHRQSALAIDELLEPTRFQKLFGAYLQSKLALALLMKDLADEQPWLGVASVNPGANKTKMTKGAGMPTLLLPLRHLFFANPKKGAMHLYRAAFESDLHKEPGVYLNEGKVKSVRIRLTPHEKQNLLRRMALA